MGGHHNRLAKGLNPPLAMSFLTRDSFRVETFGLSFLLFPSQLPSSAQRPLFGAPRTGSAVVLPSSQPETNEGPFEGFGLTPCKPIERPVGTDQTIQSQRLVPQVDTLMKGSLPASLTSTTKDP